jgi:hypothetical protein
VEAILMSEAVEKYAQNSKMEDRLNTIRNIIQKNYSKEQILDLGFTEEEYTLAAQKENN